MAIVRLTGKLRRWWNWIRGKRIVVTDPARGRVMIRTGRNSATRDNGGQWYLLRYETANGVPPLPRCSRGRLDRPVAYLEVIRASAEELLLAKRWYERRHGPLPAGQDLDVACAFDDRASTGRLRVMRYRPNEVFEVEHPWLSSRYSGSWFSSYFGTWYGSGRLEEADVMDFETFWEVRAESKPLPRWGASWR
jgi:hypothetical protein